MAFKMRGQLKPMCRNCRNKYDINQAVANADKSNSTEIRCPHCGQKTGKAYG